MSTITPSPQLEAFLTALDHADAEEFCTPPGLGGGWRVKHVRLGLERGVVVVHSSELGFAIAQPDTHGACGYCKGRKGSQPCTHCACQMCSWFRQTEERASPRVSRARMQQLVATLRAFQFAGPKLVTAPALDDDL